MTKPEFKIGDVVRHKASGEKGVVTRTCAGCELEQWCDNGNFCARSGFGKMMPIWEEEIERVEDVEASNDQT